MKEIVNRMLDTSRPGNGHGGLAMITGKRGSGKALLIEETVRVASELLGAQVLKGESTRNDRRGSMYKMLQGAEDGSLALGLQSLKNKPPPGASPVATAAEAASGVIDSSAFFRQETVSWKQGMAEWESVCYAMVKRWIEFLKSSKVKVNNKSLLRSVVDLLPDEEKIFYPLVDAVIEPLEQLKQDMAIRNLQDLKRTLNEYQIPFSASSGEAKRDNHDHAREATGIDGTGSSSGSGSLSRARRLVVTDLMTNLSKGQSKLEKVDENGMLLLQRSVQEVVIIVKQTKKLDLKETQKTKKKKMSELTGNVVDQERILVRTYQQSVTGEVDHELMFPIACFIGDEHWIECVLRHLEVELQVDRAHIDILVSG
jgi:hypothetical protein